MEKQKITEKMGIHKEWYLQAKNQTLERLPKFLKHLMEDYSHDYGTICHALSAGSLATAWAMNEQPQGGITGFQAGAIMWQFISNWSYENNKTGLKIVNFDNLLYPQYEHEFTNTISKNTWKLLQKQAKVNLEKEDMIHPDVKAHWQQIVNGKMPFGFVLSED